MKKPRRIDEVKNKKMKNVKHIQILDKRQIKIVFYNNQEITLEAHPEEFGYDAGVYIKEDTKGVTHHAENRRN